MRRDNNFDLLRLGLAWIVVFTHCRDLSGATAFDRLRLLMQSGRAVEGFFAISGCLIVASWDRSRSAGEYFMRRAKRILPTYWLAIIFSLIVGTVMTQLRLAEFWLSIDTWKYIFFNLLFLNFLKPGLPGVFASNPAGGAMDGALWTIKIEVAFYFFVPVLVWLVRTLGKGLALGLLFAVSVAYRLGLEHLGKDLLARQLPGQLMFFVAGTAVYYFFSEFNRHKALMWAVAIILMLVALVTGSFLADSLATPLFILCIAFLLPPYRGITKYGDFSYGTYALHFPFIQTLVALGLFTVAPWLSLGLVVIAVGAFALFSWFAVERRFLLPGRVRQQEHQTSEPVI